MVILSEESEELSLKEGSLHRAGPSKLGQKLRSNRFRTLSAFVLRVNEMYLLASDNQVDTLKIRGLANTYWVPGKSGAW